MLKLHSCILTKITSQEQWRCYQTSGECETEKIASLLENKDLFGALSRGAFSRVWDEYQSIV